MGSGSSARKTAEIASVAEELKADTGVRAKYRASASAGYSESEPSTGSGNVRPCDRCGETRKTARCGGQGWLCVVCQLDSGTPPTVQKPRRISENTPEQAPQPLRRSTTAELEEKGEARERRRRKQQQNAQSYQSGDSAEDGSSGGPKVRGARRAAKERAPTQDGSADGAKPQLRASLTGLEDRQGFRGLKGLNELRGSLGRSNTSSNLVVEDDEPEGKHAPPIPIPTTKRKHRLPGGFHCGDRVASLITRARRGLQVLELGNQGTVVSAKGDDDSGEEVRLLVQFDGGVDWFLSPGQICLATALPDAKTTGLARFAWGARVRSLVTYMCPESARKSVWLGDPGTILGPGRTPGKLAVRFDDNCSEWSIWPSSFCGESDFPAMVQEKLPGGCCRGDRVRATVRVTGTKSCTGGPHVVAAGDEGTVVGPGHAEGRLLVHFDHDQRVWSLTVDQVTR